MGRTFILRHRATGLHLAAAGHWSGDAAQGLVLSEAEVTRWLRAACEAHAVEVVALDLEVDASDCVAA